MKNQVPMPVFEPATNRSETIYYGSKGIAREVSTPLIKWYIDRYTWCQESSGASSAVQDTSQEA